MKGNKGRHPGFYRKPKRTEPLKAQSTKPKLIPKGAPIVSVWKYVMFEVQLGDGTKQHLPLLFPAELTHSVMAEPIEVGNYIDLDDDELASRVQHAIRVEDVQMRNQPWRNAKPVSAGFISGLSIFGADGHSETLNLKALPQDKATINQFQFLKGLQ